MLVAWLHSIGQSGRVKMYTGITNIAVERQKD